MPGEPLWWKPSYIFFQEDLQPALDTALSHKIKRNVQTWHTSSVQQKLKYISHGCRHSNMWETLKEANMMNRYNLYFSKILPHTSVINHPGWVCVTELFNFPSSCHVFPTHKISAGKNSSASTVYYNLLSKRDTHTEKQNQKDWYQFYGIHVYLQGGTQNLQLLKPRWANISQIT